MGLWREHTIPFLGRMTQAAQVDAMNGIRTPPQRSLRSLENLDESPHALRKTESQAGAKKDYGYIPGWEDQLSRGTNHVIHCKSCGYTPRPSEDLPLAQPWMCSRRTFRSLYAINNQPQPPSSTTFKIYQDLELLLRWHPPRRPRRPVRPLCFPLALAMLIVLKPTTLTRAWRW